MGAGMARPQFDRPVKLLVVVAQDQAAVADALQAGAVAEIAAAAVLAEVIAVPRLREIAPAVAMAERLAEFDGYVVLGAAIGADAALASADHGLGLLGLQGACIGHGILSAQTGEAALAAAIADGQNKGAEAAAAALHLVALSRKWAGQTKGIGFRA